MAVGPSTMIAINREQNDTIIPEHRDVFRDDAASENEGRRSGRATLGYHIYTYIYLYILTLLIFTKYSVV